jgi:hypothetical protein
MLHKGGAVAADVAECVQSATCLLQWGAPKDKNRLLEAWLCCIRSDQ